jgi:hypothetical protein
MELGRGAAPSSDGLTMNESRPRLGRLPPTWAFVVGAGDGNRTRAISLGMSAGLPPTCAAAGRQTVGLSVSIRESRRVTYRSGTQRARCPVRTKLLRALSHQVIYQLTCRIAVHRYAVGGNIERRCAAKIRPMQSRSPAALAGQRPSTIA